MNNWIRDKEFESSLLKYNETLVQIHSRFSRFYRGLNLLKWITYVWWINNVNRKFYFLLFNYWKRKEGNVTYYKRTYRFVTPV